MAADGRLDLRLLSGAGAARKDVPFWTGTRWVPAPMIFSADTADGPPPLSPFWLVTDETCDSGTPSFVSGDAVVVDATSTDVPLSFTGIAPGDLMLVVMRTQNTSWASTPAGWTQLRQDSDGNGNLGQVFYRIADGSDGATPSVTVVNGGLWYTSAVALAYRSASLVTSDWNAAVSAGSSLDRDAPSVTATGASLLVCVWASDSSSAVTPPGSMTSRAGATGSPLNIGAADEPVTAGATGTRTADIGTWTGWAAYSLILGIDAHPLKIEDPANPGTWITVACVA